MGVENKGLPRGYTQAEITKTPVVNGRSKWWVGLNVFLSGNNENAFSKWAFKMMGYPERILKR